MFIPSLPSLLSQSKSQSIDLLDELVLHFVLLLVALTLCSFLFFLTCSFPPFRSHIHRTFRYALCYTLLISACIIFNGVQSMLHTKAENHKNTVMRQQFDEFNGFSFYPLLSSSFSSVPYSWARYSFAVVHILSCSQFLVVFFSFKFRSSSHSISFPWSI